MKRTVLLTAESALCSCVHILRCPIKAHVDRTAPALIKQLNSRSRNARECDALKQPHSGQVVTHTLQLINMLSQRVDDAMLTIRFPTLTRVSKVRPVLRSRIPDVLMHGNQLDEDKLQLQLAGFRRLQRRQEVMCDVQMREFVLHQYTKQRAILHNHDAVYRQYADRIDTPPLLPPPPPRKSHHTCNADPPTPPSECRAMVSLPILIKHCPEVLPKVHKDAIVGRARQRHKIIKVQQEHEARQRVRSMYDNNPMKMKTRYSDGTASLSTRLRRTFTAPEIPFLRDTSLPGYLRVAKMLK